MIDEKILIERLEGRIETYQHIRQRQEIKGNHCMAKHNENLIEGIEDAIDIVEDLAEERKNGWIPCERELPDTEDYVLVCAVGKNEGVFIAYFEEETEKWRYDTDEGTFYYIEVIAWQPLPTPYQKEV